jgi:hypothetical protein
MASQLCNVSKINDNNKVWVQNTNSFCCVQDEDEDIFYFSCYQDNLKHRLNVYMR